VCTVLSNVSSVSIVRQGATTGTVVINLTGVSTTSSYTLSVSNSHNNLTVSPTSKVVTGTQSATFTIKSTTGQTGTYTIYIGSSTTCFKAITVTVTSS
jgi:hypothetical protein